MAMISNAKAEKLSGKCCKVAQYSMDVELFCHTMAQKLCASSGKKYWFCNDYDVEVVDIGKFHLDLYMKHHFLVLDDYPKIKMSPIYF